MRGTGDTAGVSCSWAALTRVNNAAWFAYFALSGCWTALVPSSAATLLAGVLATMLLRRGLARARPAVLIGGWVALLVAGFAAAGRDGLGTLLTVAFVLQVTPSVWTAYRTARPTGVSRGTWMPILGELSCWTVFGVHQSDPRLLTLGVNELWVEQVPDPQLPNAQDALVEVKLSSGPQYFHDQVKQQLRIESDRPTAWGRSARQHGHRCIPMLLERWPGASWRPPA